MKKLLDKKVIDLTNLTDEEKIDANLMYQLFLNYKVDGGNLDSLIYDEPDRPLMTLKDFCDLKGLTAVGVVDKLLNNGAMSLYCDFIYNEKTHQIFEQKGFGLNWMQQNWGEPKEQDNIKLALNNLINNLPDDYNNLKGFNVYNYYDNKFTEYQNPISYIFSRFPNAYLLKVLVEKKPKYKDYFEETIQVVTSFRGTHETQSLLRVEEILQKNSNRNREHSNFSIALYENGIGLKYFHDIKQSAQLHDLVLQGVRENNINFIKKVTKNINLKEVEKDLYCDSLSLAKSKTKEMAQLLISVGAPDFSIVNTTNQKIEQYAILGEYQTNIETFKVVLDTFPERYKKLFEEADGQGNLLFAKKSPEFVQYAIEKFNLDISNKDMLSWADDKYRENDEVNIYSYVKSKGANFDICHHFIEKAVRDRDEGLKRIRRLNKDKVLDSKGPAFIHEVLKNKPTKTFLSYYDKLTEVEFNREDSLKRIAWWGCQTKNELSFITNKVKKIQLENSEGKNYFHYLLENKIEKINYAKHAEKELCENVIKKYVSVERENSINWNYKDKNENNLLHLVFNLSQYYKDEVSNDLIKGLIDNKLMTIDKINELLKEPNKDGLLPLDNLDKALQDKHCSYKAMKGLEDFYNITKEGLNVMCELKKGLTIAEFLYETVKNEDLKKEIHMNMLSQMLPNKEGIKKKVKL